MSIQFYKYHGAGNDFIMLDNFSGRYDSLTVSDIVELCNRRFGVGADGLIRINKSDRADFYVDYFNADGTQSFCGNGARCSAWFAHQRMGFDTAHNFDAIDGLHKANITKNEWVELEMSPVKEVQQLPEGLFANTGSPHVIIEKEDLSFEDIILQAHQVRYNERFAKEGVNVNFVASQGANAFAIRTYERGVEGETLACGTGITATALALGKDKDKGIHEYQVQAAGGKLRVQFDITDRGFENILLCGPAVEVFSGEY